MTNETPENILQYCKGIGKYIGMSSFFIFQVATIFLITYGQGDLLGQIYGNPVTHLLLVLGLIEWGYFSADRTITDYLRNTDQVGKFFVIAAPIFVKMTIITDLVYFMIGTWAPFEAHITDESQRQFLHEKMIQAQLFSIVALFSNSIFFYGRRMWNNIRMRDLIANI